MNSTKQSIYFIIAALVVVLGLSFFLSKGTPTAKEVNLDPSAPIGSAKGEMDAPVKIVEYSDLQCPACKYYHEVILKDVFAKAGDKIYFEYRHFPLKQVHKNATIAAYASEAAGIQGKFFEMIDKLFEKQEDWSLLNEDEVKEIFISYAKEMSLDIDKFRDDMDSVSVKEKISTSESAALRMQLSGTPSFFVNGKKIENPRSPDDFIKLIDEVVQNNAK